MISLQFIASQQDVPWRPTRAAPETKDFLTTKTRVANHSFFPSTAQKDKCANLNHSNIDIWWSRDQTTGLRQQTDLRTKPRQRLFVFCILFGFVIAVFF